MLLRSRSARALGAVAGVFALAACGGEPQRPQEARGSLPPNFVLIVADDLGYGDLGSYGQKVIRTPHLDHMAAEGLRFRSFYAGATVCAPSRSVLMTGLHGGHTPVRGNAASDLGPQSLGPDDETLAEALQELGYATGMFGKWGLGDMGHGGEKGLPDVQGFDEFYGYLNQVHAHNYYPEFLWDGRKRHVLRNVVVSNERSYGGFRGGHATEKVDYSHDLIVQRALDFVRRRAEEPFFLYLPLTIPHANNEAHRAVGDGQEVPDYGPYRHEEWPAPDKGQAAMITRMDAGIGQLLELLEELDLAEQTLVLFTSDNGPHAEGGHDLARFEPRGPLRGRKRDLYEGGIRVPLIAHWPTGIPEDLRGAVVDHVGYAGDFFNTFLDLAGGAPRTELDSLSFAPTLRGDQQAAHASLYWELYERGGSQAVRQGRWKAVRAPIGTGAIELFDLTEDLGEARDLAAQHPDVVRRLAALMDTEHVPHPNWTPRGEPVPSPPPGDGQPRF